MQQSVLSIEQLHLQIWGLQAGAAYLALKSESTELHHDMWWKEDVIGASTQAGCTGVAAAVAIHSPHHPRAVMALVAQGCQWWQCYLLALAVAQASCRVLHYSEMVALKCQWADKWSAGKPCFLGMLAHYPCPRQGARVAPEAHLSGSTFKLVLKIIIQPGCAQPLPLPDYPSR